MDDSFNTLLCLFIVLTNYLDHFVKIELIRSLLLVCQFDKFLKFSDLIDNILSKLAYFKIIFIIQLLQFIKNKLENESDLLVL